SVVTWKGAFLDTAEQARCHGPDTERRAPGGRRRFSRRRRSPPSGVVSTGNIAHAFQLRGTRAHRATVTPDSHRDPNGHRVCTLDEVRDCSHVPVVWHFACCRARSTVWRSSCQFTSSEAPFRDASTIPARAAACPTWCAPSRMSCAPPSRFRKAL